MGRFWDWFNGRTRPDVVDNDRLASARSGDTISYETDDTLVLVQTNQEPLEKDISEPVIELLKRIELDEWEPRIQERYERVFKSRYTDYSLVNIYNEQLVLSATERTSLGMYSDQKTELFLGIKWPTEDEAKALVESIVRRSREIEAYNKKCFVEVERIRMANMLGV